MIILPRQARDKHREITQKKTVFLQGIGFKIGMSVRQTKHQKPFFAPFLRLKNNGRLPRQARDAHEDKWGNKTVGGVFFFSSAGCQHRPAESRADRPLFDASISHPDAEPDRS